MTKSAAVTAQTATTTAKTISLKITIAHGSRAGRRGRQNNCMCRPLPDLAGISPRRYTTAAPLPTERPHGVAASDAWRS
jgi:hypothetical protein